MAPANTDEPRGAWPAGRVLGMHTYAKGVTAIYPGDFVALNSGGLAFTGAAGNTHLIGVAVDYQAASGTSVLVYDDPDQEYWLQDDGAAATLAATNVGNNFDVVATVGNVTMLKSQAELDASDTAGVATAQLRLIGKHADDSWGKNIRVRVFINEHAFAKKLTGV